MASMTTKITAVAATAALAFAGATGVASAEEGLIPGSSLGSVELEAGNTGTGSVDTTDSLIGEPTTGSLAGSVSDSVDRLPVNSVNPAPGTGSVDTTDSLIGEPTTGSAAPQWSEVAGSLGVGQGVSTVVGSSGDDDILPVVLIGGSVAAIAAGVAFAPEIHGALTDAGVELPPLPGQ